MGRSWKDIIRDAAKELRKKMVPNLDDCDWHPLKFVPEYEWARSRVCKTKDEENFFEWFFVFGSEKAAKEFELWNQGFWRL